MGCRCPRRRSINMYSEDEMLNVESKILAALRGKPIVPMIGVAKVIEKMHEFHAARRTQFAAFVAESPISQEGDR